MDRGWVQSLKRREKGLSLILAARSARGDDEGEQVNLQKEVEVSVVERLVSRKG